MKQFQISFKPVKNFLEISDKNKKHSFDDFSNDDKVLHTRFEEYGRNAREWMRKCVLMLPEINSRQIWRKKGFESIYVYAAKLAGMSRDQVNEGLRIMKKTEQLPQLRKVIELKGVGAVKPVVNLATPQSDSFWAGKAKEMSKNTLEVYVRGMKEQNSIGRPRTVTDRTEDQKIISNKSQIDRELNLFEKNRIKIEMELEPEVAQQLRKLKGQSEWNELMKEFLKFRHARLDQDKPQAKKTESRYIPSRIQRYVIKKTNGNCAFPGCSRPYEFLHHTQRFASERVHDPDRLVPLCKAHERIAHLGLIEKEERSPESWRLRDEADPKDLKNYIDELVALYRPG